MQDSRRESESERERRKRLGLCCEGSIVVQSLGICFEEARLNLSEEWKKVQRANKWQAGVCENENASYLVLLGSISCQELRETTK